MNKVILIGRLTRDPDIRYGNANDGSTYATARYTLAVDRNRKKDGDQNADFISCVAFRQQGEFAEKYLRKGMKIAVTGRIQTGSYRNKDGNTVYTTDVVVESHEFCESKNSQGQGNNQGGQNQGGYRNNQQNGGYQNNQNGGYQNNQQNGGYQDYGNDGFMNIPEGLDEDLPFN